MERFGLSDVQATAILEMRLKALQGLEKEKLLAEYEEIEKKIEYYKQLLESEEMLKGVLCDELTEISNRFGDDRVTEIQDVEDEIDIEDLIEEKNCVYTLTNQGYIKRLSEENYKVQKRGGKGVIALTTKEEDFVEELITASTHSYLMFFTTLGRVHKIKGYEIPESSRQAKGMNVVNLLSLQEGEKVTAIIPVNELEEDKYFNMVTRNGVTKRSKMTDFKNIRKTGLNAVDLDEGDSLVSVRLTDGNQSMLVAANTGLTIRYDENDARVMGRNARGVRAIRLEEGEYVVGAVSVDDGDTVLTITENGYGKRSPVVDYRPQTRGGKGIIGQNVTEKTGQLAGIRKVSETDDLIVISSDGNIIRTKLADIPVYGRASNGVRIMRFNDGVKVVNIATIAQNDDENIEENANTENVENKEVETNVEE